MENHLVANPPLIQQPSETDDQDIFDNIDGRMQGPMNGFIKKYFGNFQYSPQGALEVQTPGGVSWRCTVPSAAPSSDSFLEWFSNYVSPELDGSWDISSGDGENDDNGARLLLTMPASPATSNRQATRWGDVEVIGQFYSPGSVCYQDGLLRLCRSAHQVFANQPTRLFLHGFYIRGSLVEVWVFDRSGLYCSDQFHVQKDFARFFSILLSYQRMTDQELGKLSIIDTDDGGRYIHLDNPVMPSLRKLYLDSNPIASREKLVGTGTTCYRARLPDLDRWDYVLKFKWRWARDRPEDELIKLAKEKGVWGTVSLDHYEEVESTANLRRSLRWGRQRKFARTHFRNTEGQDRGLAEYTEETDDFFQNRILACSVTSPVGRPLHTFQSLLELLQVFRDAIKCHRSLYHDAQILHQDVSAGNIIILDGQDEGKPRGILIDLDSAIQITEAEEAETEFNITGTRPFMAIGVLKGEPHTYRHDLESFLYVFLWAIITNRTESPPETSKLQRWSSGGWEELAECKLLDMGQDGFQPILGEFTSEFHSLKPLVESLHQILFPERAGEIWTGTDGSPEAVDRLYDEMVQAIEEAIASEAGRCT